MAKRRKQSLLSGATVLVAATLIVKIIGAIYKIPLSSMLGEVGYGYFSGAYNIYTYVYSISMAGFPIAVARMVSEYVATNNLRSAHSVFDVSKKVFLIIGVFCTVLMMAIAIPYSSYIKAPMNYVSIIAIAPCVFFCCMMSAYRGLYQGLQDMFPTGISQVIEAVCKLVLGLALSYAVIKYGLHQYQALPGGVGTVFGVAVENEAQALAATYPYAAAGAIFGVTAGSVYGLLYLITRHNVSGTGYTRRDFVNCPPADDAREITRMLIKISVPIAIGALVFNVSNFIDDITIRRRLAHALAMNLDKIKDMYSYSLTMSETADNDIGIYLYGVYNIALNLKNLIPAFTLTLGTSAVPALAASWTKKDKKGTRKTIESVFRITMLIAFPAGFGMAALATPIMEFLYVDIGNRPSLVPVASDILVVCSLGAALFAIAVPLSNMLQAVGRTDVPLKSIVVGSVAKILFNFILVGNPSININGAAVSSIISYVFIVGINLFYLLRETGARISVKSVLVKPLIAGLGCGIVAFVVNKLLCTFIHFNPITLVLSVGAGAVTYAALLILIKGISRDDIIMLPKGEKIEKVLEKFHALG